MSSAPRGESGGGSADADVDRATAPARWLLEAGLTGVPLTQTYALARTVVREAVRRWPDWWHVELHGLPHREAEVRVLEELHGGLRRLRLMRRRGRRLVTTARGREALAAPRSLLSMAADDLADEPFGELVAETVREVLAAGPHSTHAELVAAARRRAVVGGWRGETGHPPDERHISCVLSGVLCRAEAYGLIARRADPHRPRWLRDRITLTEGGRAVLSPHQPREHFMSILVFDADLTNVRGVRARLAVGADQHLTALHDAIQEAFGWFDDHLYSFWLDGRFWGDEDAEYTSPDEGPQTADVPLAELDLAIGQKVAYVFDFGDEWRVRLTVRDQAEPDGALYPRVLTRKGTAPPQYPALDEVDELA